MTKRIFISYSDSDRAIGQTIENGLQINGFEVIKNNSRLKAGTNWLNQVNRWVEKADIILVICSKNALNSTWADRELESLVFKAISDEKKYIIPIQLDDAPLPGYLSGYMRLKITSDPDLNEATAFISTLSKVLERITTKKASEIKGPVDEKENTQKGNEHHISRMKSSLKSGQLTIVCGAGVSIGAKVPSWNELLYDLLGAMTRKLSKSQDAFSSKVSPSVLKKKLTTSSLVVGKYLQSNLGKDFLKELREALYTNNPKTCGLIDAIVDVARPQRDGKPLDSIITFNFDALIEENLERNNIRFKAIYAEGIRNKPEEIPIYHVHGYLPRTGTLSEENNVVLSEDAYHTQFIEPFSWANLIQLNKLSQNCCLLVGISLTDPNMRRLLDVAKRKDSSQERNHFILKKTPVAHGTKTKKDQMLMFLEEQDANELGLNVIWVDSFEEMPGILRSLLD